MYSTCLFCHAPLGKNEAIEHFPVGRWLAFDSAKGRLWVVCRACERWSLSPVEERWEAIEECERAFGETKLRASTEQIGLARLREGTTLVRIGAPQRPEMAAWRYGDQFGRRRRRGLLVAAAAGVGGALLHDLGTMVGGLAAGITSLGALNLVQVGLAIRTGRKVESVEVGSTTVRVSRVALGHVRLRRNEEFGYELEIPNVMSWRDNLHLSAARRKLSWEQRTRYVVHGDQAVAVARRALPRVNAAGGNAKVVTNAVSILEAAGGAGDVFNKLASSEHERSWWGQPFLLRLWPSGVPNLSGTLSGLPAPVRLAMEMALHEEDERRALEGELTVLEERWKEAEEIAAISDDMFLPASILDRVRRRD